MAEFIWSAENHALNADQYLRICAINEPDSRIVKVPLLVARINENIDEIVPRERQVGHNASCVEYFLCSDLAEQLRGDAQTRIQRRRI